MATLPRLTPIAPNGLKPSVRGSLAMHAYRQRARMVDVSTVQPHWYTFQQHGTDVLLYWYAQVRQLGEHLSLWGEHLGLSPSRFVAEAVTWDMVFLVEEGAAWQAGEGLVGCAYGDDATPPQRQRVHFWVAPPWRHPVVTAALVQPVLAAFFARYAVLWGITPATRRGALRAVKRWGFQEVGQLPRSEMDGDYWVDGVISVLTRGAWRAQQEEPPGG